MKKNSKITTILLIIALIIIVLLVVGIVFLVKDLKEAQNTNKEQVVKNEEKNELEQSKVEENKENVENNVEQHKVEETANDRMAKYAKNLKATYYELAKNEDSIAASGDVVKSESFNKFNITQEEEFGISYKGILSIYVNKDFELVVKNLDKTTYKIDSNVSGIYRVLYSMGGFPRILVTHFDGHVSYLEMNASKKVEVKLVEGASNIVSVVQAYKTFPHYYLIDIDGNVICPADQF